MNSEKVCPICQEDMVRCAYVGAKRHARNVGDVDYVPLFADDELGEDGQPNYFEIGGHDE